MILATLTTWPICFYMFYGCKYLYELDLRNWNLENVRNFEGMFAECRSLRNLTLGKNKDLIKIENNINEIIKEEEEEEINEINKKPAILRNYMFYNCKNLRDLDISDEVAIIDDPKESRNMFLGTTKLRTISCNTECKKAIKENMEILGLCKEYTKTYKEMQKMKEQVEFDKKEEFKIKKEEEEIKEEKEGEIKEEKDGEDGEDGEDYEVVKDVKEILDYKFYDRDKINNFIKCTNIFTIETLFNQYKNNFKFDVIEILDIKSKEKKVAEFIGNNIKDKKGYVFDIICKEETEKYRNYIIYTNKIVDSFFLNNKCIIYVDCLYADKHIINTKYMFSECTELLFVDISKITTEYLWATFYMCPNLKYMFLPKSDFEIWEFSFYNCDNLKLVTNIEKCSYFSKNENFNTSKNLLYFMATKEQSEDKNELKCKYFDSSNDFYKDFYPTINPLLNNLPYIITTETDNFMKYVENGYEGNFLMSQENKKSLQEEENKQIKKIEEIKEEEEEEEEIKDPKKNFWEKDIVERRIKTFKEFKFDKDDFDIVKNEEEEEVKAVNQIFYRIVQDEIKDIDDFLRKKMEEWNNSKEKDKNYENFKKVFASDYKRKNLFVPKLEGKAKDEININQNIIM